MINLTGALPSTQIQLVAGTDRNQGIVRLNFNGEWGTICNESLGYAEATVICRMVGFYG